MNQLHCPTCESVIKESWNYCTICRTKLKEERKMVERVEGLKVEVPKGKEMMKKVRLAEYETLKFVLEETKRNPTPQMIEAAAKLVEAVKLDGPSY